MAKHSAIRVKNVRTVHNDGTHNAFTDLCTFRGRFYLTFRSCPDGHMVFPSSSIVIMSSDNGHDWSEIHRFSVPGRDVRDPHLLVFRERLFVYTGAWACDFSPPQERELNDHLGYGVSSDDGSTWTGPFILEGTYGHYVWRAASAGDQAFLCGRRKRGFVRTPGRPEGFHLTECALLASPDGVVWHTAGLFQETLGDETAFLVEAGGEIAAVCRTLGNGPAQVCTAGPPYKKWTRTELGHPIGGPLLARWGERYLVGGRRTRGEERRTVLWWLQDRQTTEAAELPSGGDNSYPGFVARDATHGMLSFYSSHAGSGSGLPPSAIYLADLECDA